MSRAFEPPPQWQNQFGPYRSPLIFYDGTPVSTAGDWPRRREEIRRRWTDILGPWPQLEKKPPYDVLESTTWQGSTVRRVRLELPPRGIGYAYLTIPQGAQHCPAVLVLSGDGETTTGNAHTGADLALDLAERGFVTLLIGPPGGNPRKLEMNDVECQPLMYLAYIGAVCANLLANLPEVDAAKIGVVGHAYAGKWAMFASCLDDRFACAVWSEAGIIFDERKASTDYYDPWYLGAMTRPRRGAPRREEEHIRKGAYGLLYHAGLNLQELHALMAPRPFLVSAGSSRLPSLAIRCADDESRWIVLNHSIAVNQLLGLQRRVAMINHPSHDLTPQAKEEIYRFLEDCLRGG
ncbi:MAG TPA: sialidase [Chthoniobacter sp.]